MTNNVQVKQKTLPVFTLMTAHKTLPSAVPFCATPGAKPVPGKHWPLSAIKGLDSHNVVHLKLIEYYKSTTLQRKKKSTSKQNQQITYHRFNCSIKQVLF